MKKPRNQYHHGSVREAALEAAARDIDDHGHQGFTLERVAKALRITPAALYRHFENREALLREVTYSVFERFVVVMDEATLGPVEPRARLLSMGRAYVRFALANPGWFRLQFSRAGIAISERQAAATPAYFQALLDALGALTGHDGEELNADYMLLWSTIHGVASLAIERVIPIFETDEAWLAMADKVVEHLVDGFTPASAGAAASPPAAAPTATAPAARPPRAR